MTDDLSGRTRSLRLLGSLLIQIARPKMPQYRPGPGAIQYIGADRSLPPFEVILEPDARQWLAGHGPDLARMSHPGDRIDVWLDSAGWPSEGSPVRVHVRKKLAGVLSREDGAAFWTRVEAARHNHYWVMAHGFRTVAVGSARLYVYQPVGRSRPPAAPTGDRLAGPADVPAAAREMIRRITLAQFGMARRGRGYDMEQVDAFLDRVAAALQAGTPLATVLPPEGPRFTAPTRWRGYTEHEVDQLLREIRQYAEGAQH